MISLESIVSGTGAGVGSKPDFRKPEGPGRTRPETNKIGLDEPRPTNPVYMDARPVGASGASASTSTSAPQTISVTIALDAAVRDAIVFLVSNASELVDRTLDRLPDAASEVCLRRRARGRGVWCAKPALAD